MFLLGFLFTSNLHRFVLLSFVPIKNFKITSLQHQACTTLCSQILVLQYTGCQDHSPLLPKQRCPSFVLAWVLMWPHSKPGKERPGRRKHPKTNNPFPSSSHFSFLDLLPQPAYHTGRVLAHRN